MLELFGKFRNIAMGKQRLKVVCLGRIATNHVDALFLFEGTWDFVAGQKNRKSTLWGGHPLGKFALGMGIRSIDFIQNQTHGFLIVANQR